MSQKYVEIANLFQHEKGDEIDRKKGNASEIWKEFLPGSGCHQHIPHNLIVDIAKDSLI